MGAFADTILSGLFGWLQGLVSWLWGVIDRGGSALGAWFLRNWLPLVLIIVVGGLLADWLIWMIRWRPYRVWGTRFRKIGRLFGKNQPEQVLEPAEGLMESPEEEMYWEAPIYEEPPSYPPEDTYVPGGAAPAYPPQSQPEDPDLGWEDPDPTEDAEATRVDFPPVEPAWEEDWDPVTPQDPLEQWPQEEEPAWESWEEEAAVGPNEEEEGYPSYRELLPLDEEEDEAWPEEAGQPEDMAENPLEREEEPVYDDFANRGAPEPPRKRRRWEFPEEDQIVRPVAADDASGPEAQGVEMEDIDPLAAYDAPEVMQKMQRTRRRRTQATEAQDPAGAARQGTPDSQETRGAEETGRPRRRRSQRHQQELEEDGADAQRHASASRPEFRGDRTDDVDFASEDMGDFSEPYEEPFQEPVRSQRRRRGDVDDAMEDVDAYAYGDEDDLPDPPDWPKWDEPPQRPVGRKERKVTKPSLFDRLRGVKPKQEEEDEEEWDQEDRVEAEVEKPKKRGLFGGLMNQQQEFGQPKPKPRVSQQDAYHDPVYPDKKRR